MTKRLLQGRITFRLLKDEEQAVFNAARYAGMHVGGWIRQAAREKIERDKQSTDKA